jgi:riboflavin kinase/FMN adenylyltransferase
MLGRNANPQNRTVVTIGNFEAVHAGHLALIRRASAIADQNTPEQKVVVITFDPHPATVLHRDANRSNPRRSGAGGTSGGAGGGAIMPIERRAALLKDAGANEVVVIEPTRDLLALSPEQFIERVVRDHAPASIVEGNDFRFGRDRTGDANTLRELGERLGFTTEIVNEVDIDLSDQTLVRASSTMTRWLIEHARIHDAARMLTRPHRLSGTVVQGDQRGRTIGFPTANLDTPCLLPADGVYAGDAILPSGERCPAAIHVGPRATFNDVRRTVEAHIIDWTPPDPNNPYEYNWHLRLDLHHHLRDQAKFEGIDPLVAQIERDVARALQLLRSPAPARAQELSA